MTGFEIAAYFSKVFTNMYDVCQRNGCSRKKAQRGNVVLLMTAREVAGESERTDADDGQLHGRSMSECGIYKDFERALNSMSMTPR